MSGMDRPPTTQEAWRALEDAILNLLTEMFAPVLRFAVRRPRVTWGIVAAYAALCVVVVWKA